MKFLLLNGPNLNLLGTREPEIYGTTTLADIEQICSDYAKKLDIELTCFQSNHEGVLIDTIQDSVGKFDAIVYNPGAHTHYSYAIHDAISSVVTPVIEVHISDISSREDFRKKSVLVDACIGQIAGLGIDSYTQGIKAAYEYLGEHHSTIKPNAIKGGSTKSSVGVRQNGSCAHD